MKTLSKLISVGALATSQLALGIQIDFKAEAKINFRESDANQFATNFPPDSALETADSGAHFELSNIALLFNAQLSQNWTLKSKIDVFDLYEKNPSSTDLDVSIDQFVLLYGNNKPFLQNLDKANTYFQIGKFGKFERQEDRHLESYGLVSTAFNRVEDSGLELGIDFTSGLSAKISYTSGNPVFFRDPNALAGDNGVENPEFRSGIGILYDAEVETFNLNDTPELGLAIGYSWGDYDNNQFFRLLAFNYSRDLAQTKELHGTIYGGDIDLFEFSELFTPGPIDPNNDTSSIPLVNDDKTESGLNFWWYNNNFTLFAQYVVQEIGGLDRDGAELELSYKVNTRLGWAPAIQPVIRFSTLNNDFTPPANNPSPNFGWDWQKIDVGVNVHFSKTVFFTAEYAINEFEVRGNTEDNNELLLTLTWRYD